MGVLAGRRALVTGAADGLGAAFADALAAAGARVVGLDRVAFARPGLAACVQADVADPVQVAAAVASTAERLGGLDLVVNNAGIIDRSPYDDDLGAAVEVFDRVVATNLRGAFAVGRAALPHLSAAGRGDLVNVVTDHLHNCGWPWPHEHPEGSTCPWAVEPRTPVTSPSVDIYDASKWGLLGLTLNWAHAFAPRGVRVNAFGMGATDTPMYRTTRGDRGPEDGTMDPTAVAAVLIDLLAEGPTGRTADNVQVWIGHPCVLPAPTASATSAPPVTVGDPRDLRPGG